MNIITHSKEIRYVVPLFDERNELRKLKKVTVEQFLLTLEFERDQEPNPPAKKDLEILISDKDKDNELA